MKNIPSDDGSMCVKNGVQKPKLKIKKHQPWKWKKKYTARTDRFEVFSWRCKISM